MNTEQFIKHASKFYPALYLESWISSSKRKTVRIVLCLLFTLVAGVYAVLFFGTKTIFLKQFLFLTQFSQYSNYILGALLIVFALSLKFFAIELFYKYFYFKNIYPSKNKESSQLTIDAAEMLYKRRGDITLGFLNSVFGIYVMTRLGVSVRGVTIVPFNTSEIVIVPDIYGVVSGNSIAIALVQTPFIDSLRSLKITKEDFIGASAWVDKIFRDEKKSHMWWGAQAVRKIKSIGEGLSYGQTALLQKYSTTAEQTSEYYTVDSYDEYNKVPVDELESILSKTREANALLVGEKGVGKKDIVLRLGHKIEEGKSKLLMHYKVVFLNTNLFVAAGAKKDTLEIELIRILNEVASAGNVILVFEDLASFVQGAERLGSDIAKLIDPYLVSPHLKIIGIVDTDEYHKVIETNATLRTRFERLQVDDTGHAGMLSMVENIVLGYEAKYHVFFTYQSLTEIVQGATRYFSNEASHEVVKEMVNELANEAQQKHVNIIAKQHVDIFIENKTGIKVGKVGAEEKDKLTNLEKTLHERIVGQEDAISAISNAIRRARSGINNPNRPTASFMFLGPTGVGKTESVKALAEVFFGKDASLIRLDMSEYKSADAMDKLIGSFASNTPGVLASLIRDHSHGVLLLDEFEKATKEVHDLFLQILDEGFFSDMTGKKINVRNFIIIATSNAGSTMIWDLFNKGTLLQESKNTIVDYIVGQGIYKPELLNRFDGVIVFHPLVGEQVTKVAQLMLEKLQKRLKEKGITFIINDVVLQYLTAQGSDPKFGARSIQRAIQDTIEARIAEKVIAGELEGGSEIALTSADIR